MTPADIVALIIGAAVKAGTAIYQAHGQSEADAAKALIADLRRTADEGDVQLAAVEAALARARAAIEQP